MEWRNQVAVVTGGSRGIGQAASLVLFALPPIIHMIGWLRWTRQMPIA